MASEASEREDGSSSPYTEGPNGDSSSEDSFVLPREASLPDECSQSQSLPASTSRHGSQQQDEEADESQNEADAVNQRYLLMLRTGALASPAKTQRQGNSEGGYGTRRPGRDTSSSASGSVHTAQLDREQSLVRGVTPLVLQSPHNSRPNSVSNSPLSSARGPHADPRRSLPHTPRHSLLGALYPEPRPASAPGGKLFTPGPGSYEAHAIYITGNHTQAASFSFGTQPQRPSFNCVAVPPPSTPGPNYLPISDVSSTRRTSPRLRFGRDATGARLDPHRSLQPAASNDPRWNPGAGQYSPAANHRGASCGAGAAAPAAPFSKATKMVVPGEHFLAVVHLSEPLAKDNYGIHSPGPAKYSPDISPTRRSAAAPSFGARGPSNLDRLADPRRQTSPGPAWGAAPAHDMRGGRLWGGDPNATFGRASKMWQPSAKLSATPWVSERHAATANASIFSPGPGRYQPAAIPAHVAAPQLGSGQTDRFWNRAEQGRL